MFRKSIISAVSQDWWSVVWPNSKFAYEKEKTNHSNR